MNEGHEEKESRRMKSRMESTLIPNTLPPPGFASFDIFILHLTLLILILLMQRSQYGMDPGMVIQHQYITALQQVGLRPS